MRFVLMAANLLPRAWRSECISRTQYLPQRQAMMPSWADYRMRYEPARIGKQSTELAEHSVIEARNTIQLFGATPRVLPRGTARTRGPSATCPLFRIPEMLPMDEA
jgi:hypothetical protein